MAAHSAPATDHETVRGALGEQGGQVSGVGITRRPVNPGKL
ncbi:hypothetical protein [Gordonia iterans]